MKVDPHNQTTENICSNSGGTPNFSPRKVQSIDFPTFTMDQATQVEPVHSGPDMQSPVETASIETQTEAIYSCYLHSYPCDYAKNQNDYQRGVGLTSFIIHSSFCCSCAFQPLRSSFKIPPTKPHTKQPS